mgnify:CR=1 FL=1
MTINEHSLWLHGDGFNMLGIVSLPPTGNPVQNTGVVIVVGGAQYRAGSHRLDRVGNDRLGDAPRLLGDATVLGLRPVDRVQHLVGRVAGLLGDVVQAAARVGQALGGVLQLGHHAQLGQRGVQLAGDVGAADDGVARAEQAASLLAGMLTDQQNLLEWQRYVVLWQGRCLVEKGLAAAQTQARQRGFDALGWIAEAVARLVCLAQHLQGERGAGFYRLGNFTPGSAAVSQDATQAQMLLLLDRQWQLAQVLYPGIQSARQRL